MKIGLEGQQLEEETAGEEITEVGTLKKQMGHHGAGCGGETTVVLRAAKAAEEGHFLETERSKEHSGCGIILGWLNPLFRTVLVGAM